MYMPTIVHYYDGFWRRDFNSTENVSPVTPLNGLSITAEAMMSLKQVCGVL